MRSAVRRVISVVFIGLFFAALPGPGPSSSADRVFIGALKEAKTAPGWVELVFERGRVRVSERAGGLLRIKATNRGGFSGLDSFALLDPRAPETAPRLEEREDRLVLSGSALTLTVFRSSGRMEIADSGGVILSEREVRILRGILRQTRWRIKNPGATLDPRDTPQNLKKKKRGQGGQP